MKKTVFVILLILVFSCNKPSVSIKINNKKIEGTNFNMDSLIIKKQRVVENIVEFEIVNKTDKNLLFLLKDKNLRDVKGLKIKIYENNKLIQEGFVNHDPSFDNELLATSYFKSQDSLLKVQNSLREKLTRIGMKPDRDDTFFKYYFQKSIVKANESKKIISILTLPTLNFSGGGIYSMEIFYNLKKNNLYEMELEYHINYNDIIKVLSKSQIDSLNKEKIEIFQGVLKSNKVPIVIN